MQQFSNRVVFLLGEVRADGMWADMLWLENEGISGTNQPIYDPVTNELLGNFTIPSEVEQVHTEILLPYAQPALAN